MNCIVGRALQSLSNKCMTGGDCLSTHGNISWSTIPLDQEGSGKVPAKNGAQLFYQAAESYSSTSDG